MYFADLTPYEFDGGEPSPYVLNVGWLSMQHEFARGPINPEALNAVRRLSGCPENLFRGSHLCEFCPPPPVIERNGLRFIEPPEGTAGNGEIRVKGATGKTYVAPVLVVHYIEAHGYSPPNEFVEAVLSSERDA